MGLFSLFNNTDKNNPDESGTIADSICHMDIEELGKYYTKHFKSASSINYRAKLVTATVNRLQEYSTNERNTFIHNYKSYYASTIDINFVGLVKKTLK